MADDDLCIRCSLLRSQHDEYGEHDDCPSFRDEPNDPPGWEGGFAENH